ncbi:MAG: hypothetical protein COV91_06125, partial [Candidatus Taylorbacteria bacterium CG11_big_fil_rev_8_21_14_0_20_46_11]
MNGRPDLTASAPTPSGSTFPGTSSFVANVPIRLNGTVFNSNEAWSANTSRGDFENVFQVTLSAPSASSRSWAELGVVSLWPNNPLAKGGSRAVQELEWGGDNSIAAGTYYLRLCADTSLDIVEKNEGNNCTERSLPVTVVSRPTLNVQSKLNGVLSTTNNANATITASPTAFGGTTNYSRSADTDINATLTPGAWSDYALVPVQNTSSPWESCTSVSGNNCTVNVPGGQSKTVTVNYQSKPDLTFELRKAGTSNAFQTTPLTLTYGEGVELRYQGARCNTYYSASATGTAGSSPAMSWSDNVASSPKTISNTSLSTATVSNLTNSTHTFTLSCTNSAGAVSKTLTVTVGLPSNISCAASPNPIFIDNSSSWTVTNAPSGSTYSWTGTDFNPATKTGNGVSQTYGTAGTKTATAVITASGGQTATITCSPLTVNGRPDL